jgi:signal transduction histidine kinase
MAVESDVSEAVEAAARLEEANALQRAIVDNAPASIALIDSDGRVVETNAQWDSFCRAAGLPDCRPGTDYLAACARLEAQCAAAPGDMAQACTGALSGLRTALFDVIAGRSGGFETEFPCPVDGQERYFICKIAPAPVAGGTGAVVMQIDATERRRQERALEEALARANAATEAKARFLATMSHEIRTPMNGVLGMVQTARLMGLAPEIDDMLETAETSARGLLTLIEDILDMSKLEAGRMSLTRAPFALRDLCAGVIDTLAPVARDGGLTLQCRIADDVPNAWSGDAGRLRQILFNLIGNGIKFTDKGHVSLTVRAPRHPESGRPEGLVFEIADTGIGMTDSDLAIAFDRFAQADGGLQRRHGGTGLGLAIVKELTELMGGRVDVSSRKGEGTLFTVAVPLREAETQAA